MYPMRTDRTSDSECLSPGHSVSLMIGAEHTVAPSQGPSYTPPSVGSAGSVAVEAEGSGTAVSDGAGVALGAAVGAGADDRWLQEAATPKRSRAGRSEVVRRMG